MLPRAERSQQRAMGKAARAALSREQRFGYSLSICRALEADPRAGRARVIMSYGTAPTEADPGLFCARMHSRGAVVAYPRCLSPGVMEARVAEDGFPFLPDAMGIPAPDPEHSRLVPPEELELVLVPLTVFDGACNRLGMGGGFYDRFLPLCVNALHFGVAFSVQQAQAVCTGPHERPLHGVFTENGKIEACNGE